MIPPFRASLILRRCWSGRSQRRNEFGKRRDRWRRFTIYQFSYGPLFLLISHTYYRLTEQHLGVIGSGSGADAMDVDGDDDSLVSRYFVGDTDLAVYRDHEEIVTPFQKDGTIEWDLMEKLWSHAFDDRLRVDVSERPVLFSEPVLNSKENREKTAEILFEKYSPAAFFLAKDSTLSAFSFGKYDIHRRFIDL